MPTLIIQDGSEKRGGTFEWPLLIGSCPANAVMIADNAVAHVHAWIGVSVRGYFVANVTQHGRTFVNGTPIQGRRILSDGDSIQLGSGAVRMTYHAQDLIPKGVRPVAFPWRAPHEAAPGEKESIECGCGATIVMEPQAPPKASNGNGKAVAPAAARQPAPAPCAPETAPARPIESRRAAPVPQPVLHKPAVRVTTPAPRTAPPAHRPVAAPTPAPSPARPVTRPASPIAPASAAVAKKSEPLVVVEPLELKESLVESRLQAALAAVSADEATHEATQVEARCAPASSPPPAPAKIKESAPQAQVAEAAQPTLEEERSDVLQQSILVDSGHAQAVVRESASEAPSVETALAKSKSRLPVDSRPAPETEVILCGICQSRINPGEQMTSCPDCRLTFHADCWTENRGCAAYGCSQVGVLEAADATAVKQIDESQLEDPFPWEFLLLGGSVVAIVAGALAFGVPSGLVGVATLGVGIRRGLRRWPLLLTACILCAVGIIVGLEFSKFWWLGTKPFAWMGR